MVHGGEAGGEDTADVFDILEAEFRFCELAIGYLALNHLINRLCD